MGRLRVHVASVEAHNDKSRPTDHLTIDAFCPAGLAPPARSLETADVP